jgi:hypothetical protein
MVDKIGKLNKTYRQGSCSLIDILSTITSEGVKLLSHPPVDDMDGILFLDAGDYITKNS